MKTIADTPRTHEFTLATTRRNADGFEFVLVAKTMDDLRRAYLLTVDSASEFDEAKVNFIRIKRG